MINQGKFNTLDLWHVCVCVCREQGQRSEEQAAGLRHQTLKQSPSQHSFDSAILDGSLPDESLSAESDVSDNFFAFMDSGIKNCRLTFDIAVILSIRPAHLSGKEPIKGFLKREVADFRKSNLNVYHISENHSS